MVGSEYDAGPIIAQIKVALSADDDVDAIERRVQPLKKLLLDTLRDMGSGKPRTKTLPTKPVPGHASFVAEANTVPPRLGLPPPNWSRHRQRLEQSTQRLNVVGLQHRLYAKIREPMANIPNR